MKVVVFIAILAVVVAGLFWGSGWIDELIYKINSNPKLFKFKEEQEAKRSGRLFLGAYKFEYSEFHSIVEKEVRKIESSHREYMVSEMYLVKMDELYKKCLFKNGTDLILLACFHKAAIQEPILVNPDMRESFDDVNRQLVENIIKAVIQKNEYKKNDEEVKFCIDKYIASLDDIYLNIYYIINEYL